MAGEMSGNSPTPKPQQEVCNMQKFFRTELTVFSKKIRSKKASGGQPKKVVWSISFFGNRATFQFTVEDLEKLVKSFLTV